MKSKSNKLTYLRDIVSVEKSFVIKKVVCYGMVRIRKVPTYIFNLGPCGHKKETHNRGKRMSQKQMLCEQCMEDAGEGYLML